MRRIRILSIGAIMLAATSAYAQMFPDPRQRVEIRYDRPDTRGGANFARVRDTQCRESATAEGGRDWRRRIVALAAREWEAFHFPVLDIASEGLPLAPRIATQASGARGRALLPDPINPPLDRPQKRALRLGLVEDDGAAIERIGGYWAVVPGQGAVATQNVIWGRGGWPGAGWAQPWSAAFVSWVMCEAGFSRAHFQRATSHAGYLDAIFSAPRESAFAPADLKTRLAPGDLVCAGRADNRDIATLDEAKAAAAQGGLMHCDIVVGLFPDRALLIGGNVMNAVALTIAPADAQGRIKPNAHRNWFGVMKLKAPDDARAGLRDQSWACLGKAREVVACLEER